MSPARYTRRSTIIVLIIGVVLAVPALGTPFFLDDYLHSSMVRGTFPVARSPFDLYDFIDDADRPALLSHGLLPWWSHPEVTIRFFRPVSSALLFIDHRVFGTHPFPMHVHSLLWWIAAVFAARSLFRRVLSSPRAASLATAIFALAPCHAVPLAWLANREVLISITFGALALSSYLKFREARNTRSALLGAVFFSLSLLCGGEYALCFGGYVIAIDFVRRADSLRARITGWLPFALPAALYLAVRGALHYGTRGSGFYADPIREPIRFLTHAPERLATLLADAWLTLDTTAWVPTWQKIALGVIVVIAATFAYVVVKRAFAALTTNARSLATWLCLGSLVSLAPVLAVVPSTRLLGVAMLGVAATIATVLDFAWFGKDETPSRARDLTQLAAIAFGFMHLVHGPATLWLDGRQLRADASELAWRAAGIRVNTAASTDMRVGIVRGTAGMFFAPFALAPEGALPEEWRILSQGGHVLILRRDVHTIEIIAPADRALFPRGDLSLYRSDDAPLAVGDELVVPGLRVTILKVGDLGPNRARIVFDEDPDRLTWFADEKEGMHKVTLPSEGLGEPFKR